MNTFESQNNRHSEELAAKVSRLKHVSHIWIWNFFSIIFFIFKIAFDIENETKYLYDQVKYLKIKVIQLEAEIEEKPWLLQDIVNLHKATKEDLW